MARGKKGLAGVNPQEATIPEENDDDLNDDSPQKGDNSKKNKSRGKKKKDKRRNNKKNIRTCSSMATTTATTTATITSKKRRKRNRVAHLANVQDGSQADSSTAAPSIPLPLNQYKTTLHRRAIRKRPNDLQMASPSSQQQHEKHYQGEAVTQYEEEYGDISLGMKLSVVGGKVIVQNLNSLADGKASPAQMAGIIQRGDVLLSVDNLSLVNLPIDLLMERLKPLSAPDATGAYQRILQLRLAAGEGLDLLHKYEAAEKRKASVPDEAANEVFSLFPMVDSLSGVPLFDQMSSPLPPRVEPHHQHQEEKKQADGRMDSPESSKSQGTREIQDEPLPSKQKSQTTFQHARRDQKSLNEVISSDLALSNAFDRDKFISEFFAWNEKYSELLRPSPNFFAAMKEFTTKSMTKSQMIELGRRAILGAEMLSRNMESMDRGKDNRSFRSWNSSISLHSRASTRRQYILEAVSLPVRLGTKSPAGSSRNELASLTSTDDMSENDLDDVDGDALLLRLAAHDEIWRSQVIEALEKARDDLEKESVRDTEDNEPEADTHGDINSAMTEGLGAFLFGEAMQKIVTKKKKSNALPPKEITAVLFDLSTNLASTMPDEITVAGGATMGPLKASLVPFIGRKQGEPGSSIILATRFVLDEALVVWLGTFRPLPWEARRVLWPHIKNSPTGIYESGSSRFSDTDSLTVDSPRSTQTSNTHATNNIRKDLRQQIEDQELDVETRAETCFLITYYFTQRLLPKAAYGNRITDAYPHSKDEEVERKSGGLIAFVRKFGAYMKLHTCLAYAAALKCKDTIHELLELAEHDLRHREVVKLLSKRNALILYEPTMLSAIVKCLPLIREEPSKDRRQMLVDVCVSAYPDLCPWQVKQALVEFPSGSDVNLSESFKEDLRDLYYYYLSSLLHPHDGHEAARHEKSLVEEWCILSLEATNTSSKMRDNFFLVASRNSSSHLAYCRDLVMLLKLAMSSQEHDLALDLVSEMLDHPEHTQSDSAFSLVLQYLRNIAHHALDSRNEDSKGKNAVLRMLKRVMRLYHYMATSSSKRARVSIDVAAELHSLLEYKEGSSNDCDMLDLIHFFAKETAPSDFLRAFSEWTSNHEMFSDTVPVLQIVLRRGARVALNRELSGSLLRLKRARQRMNSNAGESAQQKLERDHGLGQQTIWSLMAKGLVAIDK